MSSSRFVPNNFQYNGQVAVALGPCLVVAAAIGGKPVMATLAIGAMISYMMDALQYREGAFTCSWLTLGATHLTFLYSLIASNETTIPMMIGLGVSMATAAALTGMWVSLQFKWIQMQYPAVAIVFERALVTGAVPMAAIMHTLALALFVEAPDVPYYLAASLCIVYYCLGRPLVSSFAGVKAASAGPAIGGGRNVLKSTRPSGPAASAEVLASAIQSRLDGFLMALITTGLPALMYLAVHWTVLLRHSVHFYSLLLLCSVPTLFVTFLPRGLWWLPGPPRVASTLRLILLCVSLLAALAGFEGRVVFFAFRQYIQLHPPWDWIAVTAALLGLGAAALAQQSGLMGRTLDVTLAGTVMLLCTTAGSLAAGVPFHWLLAPLGAACGLALYYDSGSMREYSLFVIGVVATGVWFVRHHFWFLDIMVGSTHLHLMCKLLVVALVPALMVPGLVVARAPKLVLGALLMLQASLLCVLEEQLYAPSHQDFAGEVMYPAYLVLLTSAAGLAAARQLQAEGLLVPSSSWVLHSLHCAKVTMLLLPEAYLVLPSALLALAVSAPLFLHERDVPPHGVAIRRRIRLAPWQGLLHGTCILVAVVLARFAVFDMVQFLSSARPSEGVLLGSLLLTLAAGMAPLLLHCYSGNQAATRLLALLVMSGALLLFLQPPMPLRGGARCPKLPLSLCPRLWDERHVPMHGTEDVEVWGRGLARKEHWPRWLLLAACLLGAGAVTLGGPAARSITSRAGLATAAGALVGSYLALEVVPGQVALQCLLVGSCLLVVAFIVMLQLPTARVPGLLPAVFAAWLVVLGLTMLLQTELPTPQPAPEMKRLFPDSKIEVDREVWMATHASLLGVFACHALLLAFTLKLRTSAALRQQDGRLAQEGHDHSLYGGRHGTAAADLFCGIMPSQVFARFSSLLQIRGSNSVSLQRLSREGLAWAPCVGNVCTAIAFLMAMALNVCVTGGAPEAIFMLAPLLLLLSQDPLLLTGLEDKQRYFPPVLAVSLYLASAACVQAVEDGSLAADAGRPGWVSITKGLLLVAFTLPSHVLFLHWLWTQKPRAGAMVLGATPLNILPLLLAASNVPRYLAVLGLAMALIQYFAMKHVRGVGVKII